MRWNMQSWELLSDLEERNKREDFSKKETRNIYPTFAHALLTEAWTSRADIDSNCWWQAVCSSSLCGNKWKGKSIFYFLGQQLIISGKPCIVFILKLWLIFILVYTLPLILILFQHLTGRNIFLLCEPWRERNTKETPIYLPSYTESNILQNYHGIVLPDTMWNEGS